MPAEPTRATSAESDGYEVPELAAADWMQHAELFANTSFWAVTKRLPAIVREAVTLAWRASRRDTLAYTEGPYKCASRWRATTPAAP